MAKVKTVPEQKGWVVTQEKQIELSLSIAEAEAITAALYHVGGNSGLQAISALLGNVVPDFRKAYHVMGTLTVSKVSVAKKKSPCGKRNAS